MYYAAVSGMQSWRNMKFQFLRRSLHNLGTEKSQTNKESVGVKANVSPDKMASGGDYQNSLSDFDRTLDDRDTYQEYSDVVLRSFAVSEILEEIQTLVTESGILRLVTFFDDFSELNYVDQRLFVDVILSPLNNSSNENVKLKIAAYPGRVYMAKLIQVKLIP